MPTPRDHPRAPHERDAVWCRRRSLGARGERAAARACKRAGYRILGRNLRTPCAEVDLLARDRHVLVVIEVKTTHGGSDAPPPTVRHAQRARLRRAARWLAARPGFRAATGAPATFRVDFAFVIFDGRRFVVTIRRDVLPPA